MTKVPSSCPGSDQHKHAAIRPNVQSLSYATGEGGGLEASSWPLRQEPMQRRRTTSKGVCPRVPIPSRGWRPVCADPPPVMLPLYSAAAAPLMLGLASRSRLSHLPRHAGNPDLDPSLPMVDKGPLPVADIRHGGGRLAFSADKGVSWRALAGFCNLIRKHPC
ncbi:hypothetical protein FH972_026003 [Carpinus fangiana]|uniref:Uncharacterized protein n=1 Tax=Carpinus fangiana TaxID=176857 RepID=A0A5N6L2P0_9ROSI|nr:hypothetical protein FH972_026003 [Carpinus fangiana]